MTRVKLERWRAHLTAAREQGISLARYAREHGVSRHTLYAAQRPRRGAALVPSAAPFVRVELAAAPAPLRARLANGVELEFGPLAPSACAGLLGLLAALPCSG